MKVDAPSHATSTDEFHGYRSLLNQIKQRVHLARQRTIYAANEELLRMYWDIGQLLQQSQDNDGWDNLVLMKQVKDIRARYWYMVQSIANHWTTRYLQECIQLDHYGRHGALANNFTQTLPAPEADEVTSLLKDPYIFDMLTFTEQYNERDVELGVDQ